MKKINLQINFVDQTLFFVKKVTKYASSPCIH